MARSLRITPEFQVDTRGLAAVARDLKGIDPQLRKDLQASLKEAAEVVAADARRRVAPYSAHVAATVASRATGSSASVRAGGNTLGPPAVALEGRSGQRSFRHPVFARGTDRSTWTWVQQPTHPFLAPALAANADDIVDRVLTGIDRVLRQAGFH